MDRDRQIAAEQRAAGHTWAGTRAEAKHRKTVIQNEMGRRGKDKGESGRRHNEKRDEESNEKK